MVIVCRRLLRSLASRKRLSYFNEQMAFDVSKAWFQRGFNRYFSFASIQFNGCGKDAEHVCFSCKLLLCTRTV